VAVSLTRYGHATSNTLPNVSSTLAQSQTKFSHVNALLRPKNMLLNYWSVGSGKVA
jgi:hypothetical protein